jgi:RNA polymerase sigma-70 factor (ECF subfamily)
MEAMIDDTPPACEAPGVSNDSAQGWTEAFESVGRGEAEGLHLLYDRAAPQLYGLALWRTGSPDDASEIVQEVFVKVAEQGSRLNNVKNPKAWLLTVAHRLAVDLTRRRRVRETEPLDAYPYLDAKGGDPGRSVDAERASALLADLPQKQREAIYLRHFAECTFAEIARIVGVPTFTASSRYRLGVRRLRRLMEEDR